MNKLTIKLVRGFVNNQRVVLIDFHSSQEVHDELITYNSAYWDSKLSRWYIKENEFDLFGFFGYFKVLAYIDYSELKKDKLHKKTNRVKNSMPSTKSLSELTGEKLCIRKSTTDQSENFPKKQGSKSKHSLRYVCIQIGIGEENNHEALRS